MISNVKIFHMTDLHIGNNIVDSGTMLQNYMSYIRDNIKLIKDSDILAITGDITDRLLYSNSKEYKDLLYFVNYICALCSETKTTILYLDGTASHEFGQMSNIHSLMVSIYPDLKFRHYTDVVYDVIYVNDEPLSLIAVPDSIGTDEELYPMIRKLMTKHDVTKVDFMLTHKAYEEIIQYNDKISNGVQSTALYSSMVNYYILNGHIHQHAVSDKVINTGALDYITHGDSHDKGCVYVEVKNYIAKYKFIPTKHYTVFATIDGVDMPHDDLIEKIKKMGRSSIIPYHIRVYGNISKDEVKELKSLKPLMVLKVERPITKHKVAPTTPTYNVIDINKNNIIDLMNTALDHTYSAKMEEYLLEAISEVDAVKYR